MPIYALTTPGVDKLCDDVFLASVRRCEPDAKVQIARIPIEGSGNFGLRAFKSAQKMRLELIAKWIEANAGGVILVSDIDIEYLQPFTNDMVEELGDAAIAFQRETHEGGANLGQMVIRCSQETCDFFKAVLCEYLKTGEWEHRIVNRFLKSRRMAHRLLGSTFANTKTGFQASMHSFQAIQTAARNGYSSVELKLQQFKGLAEYLGKTGSV